MIHKLVNHLGHLTLFLLFLFFLTITCWLFLNFGRANTIIQSQIQISSFFILPIGHPLKNNGNIICKSLDKKRFWDHRDVVDSVVQREVVYSFLFIHLVSLHVRLDLLDELEDVMLTDISFVVQVKNVKTEFEDARHFKSPAEGPFNWRRVFLN